jgi:hypothetical protein
VGFVLTATAAAAALYGAVVLIGAGPSSPLALSRESARPQLAVHLRVHDPAASSPRARGPQPSPGLAQRRARLARVARPAHTARRRTRRSALVSTRAVTQAASPPIHPASAAAPAPVSAPALPEVAVTPAVVVPALPVVSLPPLPALPVSTP